MQERQYRGPGWFPFVATIISLITLVGFGAMVDNRLGGFGAWGAPNALDLLTVIIRGDDGGVITSTPPGIDCGQGHTQCSARFPRPTEVTLDVAVSDGNRFDGWTGDCSGTVVPCQIIMQLQQNAIATFTRLYQLQVQRSGAGTVRDDTRAIECGDVCTATYARNTSVVLRATAMLGSTFAGWGGDCTAPGDCTLQMDSDKTVSAVFKP